jgi:hypothetical protein
MRKAIRGLALENVGNCQPYAVVIPMHITGIPSEPNRLRTQPSALTGMSLVITSRTYIPTHALIPLISCMTGYPIRSFPTRYACHSMDGTKIEVDANIHFSDEDKETCFPVLLGSKQYVPGLHLGIWALAGETLITMVRDISSRFLKCSGISRDSKSHDL